MRSSDGVWLRLFICRMQREIAAQSASRVQGRHVVCSVAMGANDFRITHTLGLIRLDLSG
jgi:hypothetical protein